MRRPEQQLQIAVAQFLRLALRPPTIWTAFPAGGGGRVRGAFLKAMGLQAGFPDILILSPRKGSIHPAVGDTVAVGLELKAAKGKLSPDQKSLRRAFMAVGGAFEVCRSIRDVEEALLVYGIPLHAKAA